MKRSVLLVSVLAVFALLTAGCDLLVSPTIKVIDARTGNGIANAEVTLTPIKVDENKSQEPIKGTSGTDGTVVFTDKVQYGEYTVTGSLSGYVFIPFNVTVAGWSQDLGKIWGVATSKGGDPNAVSIFLTWNTTNDIDAYFTYPNTLETSVTALYPWSAVDAYQNLSGSRTSVNYSNKQDTTKFSSLDIDKTANNGGMGPETITLLGTNTGNASGTQITVNSGTPFIGSAIPAGNYYWAGIGEYYLNAYTTNTSLENQQVRVVITQGNAIKGIFNLPTNMTQKTISLFRVQILYTSDNANYYLVFMPDLRLVDGLANIKSIAGIPEDSVFVCSGRK
ncbi:MAG TPA: hypothetical protein PK074_03800 [Spirochaetales bacterium]|nr:hypothetical protein [Spirochaetales bacterium]